MNGCTAADKPRIAILLAVYEPRMDWLQEQLRSLDAQTYPNLMLYVRDDGSRTVSFERIEQCVQQNIHSFSYKVEQNEKNLGSNSTFERLTREAEGEYFAYCDQDDVWLPEKLSILKEKLCQTNALLVCSDMKIIDENGRQIADSITKIRRNHVFRSGKGMAHTLFFSNFVTGCTMLIRAEECKKAAPFCPYMVHDHYLALWCAERGEIVSLAQSLVRYRIHDGNQTGMMAGVADKASYGRVRIELVCDRLRWLESHFPCAGDTQRELQAGLKWAQARNRNWKHQGGAFELWKFRRFNPLTTFFEIFAAYFPEPLFMWFVGLKKKNLL